MQEKIVTIDFQRDLREISHRVDQYIRQTYIQNIEKELEHCRKQAEREETKEISLLKAMRPFVAKEKQEELTKLIELIRYEKVIAKMLPKLTPTHTPQTRGSKEGNLKQVIIALILYQILSQT